ncbi:MAG: mandelate racemase/muconate lactonizing enzyme family protein [Caldilineaceae bacterium SB0665_bin_21]|nr:mandelate racemase/muconate lactonizing enzyme family protein [Caldilineaceae bacterium SB0665_bin_21]MYA04830.1 mandelate racemase/muconate lactonizing enzyme family protein [Caldilineaceae bacterium SB0664_bin_22]
MLRIRAIRTEGVQVNRRGDWIFVVLETEEGLTGIGEASHSGNDRSVCGAVVSLAEELIGKDPANINGLRRELGRYRKDRVINTALSAIEQAAQDVRAQVAGMSLARLWGGKVLDRVLLYANINRHVEERSPASFAKAAETAAAEGFRMIKLAPFDEVKPPNQRRSADEANWWPGVERVRAVREAVGSGIRVAVDCHSRFALSESFLVAAALEPLNLYWFEEPLPVSNLKGLHEVRSGIRQRLATAESLFGADSFHRLLEAGAADVVMPDVKHAGGDQETLLVGELAALHGVDFAPHNPSGPVASMHSGHVCAAARGFNILEFAWGEVPWRAELLDPPEQIEDGYLIVSDRPGLGHTLNAKTMRRFWLAEPDTRDSSKAEV